MRRRVISVLAAALAALGVLLYGFRDRTLSDEAREALIFGGPERRYSCLFFLSPCKMVEKWYTTTH